MTHQTPRASDWRPAPKNDRLKRWQVIDTACPGRGKEVIAENIRSEKKALLVAASPELYRIAEVIEAAYADGPAVTFHTRLNELSGGSFAHLLLAGLGKARGEP